MSYIDVQETKESIITWERIDGELVKNVYPKEDFCYLFIPDNSGSPSFEYKNMYGDPMKKINFDNPRQMRKWAEGRDGVCESDIRPVYKSIIDLFSDCNTEEAYNVLLWDIEVDFDLTEGKGYPTPKNPYGEINSISTYDVHNDVYVMFIPDKHKGNVVLEYPDEEIWIEWCSSERDMLMRFCDFIDHIDILSAWNGDVFDIAYLIERLKKHFGEAQALSMLCRDGIQARRRDFVNEYKEDVWEYTLAGRIHLDLMQVYKKFVPGEAKSFSLDAVCERELGETKVEYEDNLGELYRSNPQKFFEYSLHDSRLLKKLDEKKQIIKLAMTMARDMCALPSDVLGSVKIIEAGIIKHMRKRGNIVAPDKVEHKKGEQYAGAVVYESIPGRHTNVMSADLVSLYPKSMIILGFSPETFMYHCKGGYEDYVAIMDRDDSDGEIEFYDVHTNESYSMLPTELEDIIRQEGFTIAANGSIFSGEMGIIAEWLSDNFDLRAEYKRKMKEAFDNGDAESGKMYDLYQQVTKIGKLNSVYGAVGNEHCRFYDIRLAEAVTLTAQIISKAQATFVNDAINIMDNMTGE